jgi:hypothetical protein
MSIALSYHVAGEGQRQHNQRNEDGPLLVDLKTNR